MDYESIIIVSNHNLARRACPPLDFSTCWSDVHGAMSDHLYLKSFDGNQKYKRVKKKIG